MVTFTIHEVLNHSFILVPLFTLRSVQHWAWFISPQHLLLFPLLQLFTFKLYIDRTSQVTMIGLVSSEICYPGALVIVVSATLGRR